MIVVAALDGRFSVAVTVETAPVSAIDVGDTAIVTSGGSSSSVIVNAVPVTLLPTPWSLRGTTGTVTLLFGAWVMLSTAVMSTVSVAFAVCPAAMTIVESVAPTV